jgi:hypothetical protein
MAKCKKIVYPKDTYGSFRGYQCSREAVIGDFCKQHSPEEYAKRQDASYARYKERARLNPLNVALETASELRQQNALLRELLVECRGYMDRITQQGLAERIDKALQS